MRQSLDEYVDQVKRKEQFLAEHPDVHIVTDFEAPPHERWRGRVPGYADVTSHELALVLDRLDDLVAARDAGQRWPGWTFTRRLGDWQAQSNHGPELVTGRTLAQVEALVAEYERIARGKRLPCITVAVSR